jgi:hypothetical protein
MQDITTSSMRFRFLGAVIITLLFLNPQKIISQSLDIPVKGYGISFGNSKKFSGFRLNFRDQHVEEINGMNVTLWPAKENNDAIVNGLSVGVMPVAGKLQGLQIGAVGVGGRDISGINLGGLGVGSDGSLNGISIGGIGAGAGNNLTGISIGGLGAGAGNEIKGIVIGGLGAGAGNNCTGIIIGGLGAGAGNNMTGITIGGLGAGAGNIVQGITIGGLGAGAGDKLVGLSIGGLGAGSGNELTGVAIGGLGAGAPVVNGLTIGGVMTGGLDFTGMSIAGIWMKIEKDGKFEGLAVSPFNQVRGYQNGVSIGVVNYARKLKGIQIGLINYVRDNPKYLKVLPIFNAHFN